MRQLSERCELRDFGCNYLLGAISWDEQYLAALLDEAYVGIFSLKDLISPLDGGLSREQLGVLQQVAPIFKIPISVPTSSSSSGSSDISSNGKEDTTRRSNAISKNIEKPTSGAAADRAVRDLSWSPGHVGGGMLLAVAGGSSIAVWEVPNIRQNRSANSSAGDISLTAPAAVRALAPSLLHSLDLRPAAPAPSTPPLPAATPVSLRRIEWHSCALPTLIAFSVTSNPIKIVLPRRSKGAAVTGLFECQSNPLSATGTLTASTYAAAARSAAVDTAAAMTSSPSPSVSQTRLTLTPSKSKIMIHPFGSVSVQGKQVYTADSSGCLTVLLDPLNDAKDRIVSESASSGMLGMGSAREVRAMCVSSDDSLVCVSYSIPTASSPSCLLSPSSSLLSLKGLQAAVSNTRAPGGFTHILAGASLHDALYVPSDEPVLATAQTTKHQHVNSALFSAISISDVADKAVKSESSLSQLLSDTELKSESDRGGVLNVVSVPGSLSAFESLMSVGSGMMAQSSQVTSGLGTSAGGGGGGGGGMGHSRVQLLGPSDGPRPSELIGGTNTITSSAVNKSNGDDVIKTSGPSDALYGEVEICMLRYADTAAASLSDEHSRDSGSSDSSGQLVRVFRVPITDPIVARPDLIACYLPPSPSPHPSSLPSPPSSSSPPCPPSSLKGFLAVASSQSGKVLVFAVDVSVGCTAPLHSQHALPGNQKCRGLSFSKDGNRIFVLSAAKASSSSSGYLASGSASSQCATFLSTIPLSGPRPIAHISSAERENSPSSVPPSCAKGEKGEIARGAISAGTDSSDRGSSSSDDGSHNPLLAAVLSMQATIMLRLDGIEETLRKQQESLDALHYKADRASGIWDI